MGRPSDPTSLNRYAYAEGNPTSLIDPGGHTPALALVGLAVLNGIFLGIDSYVAYQTWTDPKSSLWDTGLLVASVALDLFPTSAIAKAAEGAKVAEEGSSNQYC